MNARQFLNRAYKLNLKIDSKLEQLERLRALSYRVTSALKPDKISSGSRSKSPMENAIVRIVVAETEINASIDRYIDIKKDISEYLDLLSNDNERILLELRYLCLNSWEQIAVKMNVSISYTYELHRNAINSFNQLLEVKNGGQYD